MDEFVHKNVVVKILGKEYAIRELSLAQKNKLLGTVGGFIRDIAANAFFRKDDTGGLHFNFADEVSLAELNIDKIILSSIEATPELLRLSIPDFKDWDNLPESASREALLTSIQTQDFKGYIENFISAGGAIFR